MDVLERLGGVNCHDDQGRRRRVVNLARQVEEVHYEAKRTTVFATAIGEGNGLGIAPDWLARSRIESDWSVARDPGQRGA